MDPIGGCATLANIRWPAEFSPERAPVHVKNVLRSQADATLVWAWLVRASQWPAWYPNAADVRLPENAKDLTAGMTFHWRTFGVGIVSHVEEFVPGERIAWNARGLGVWAYHAWLIEPAPSGCTILTEESQYGWLARLGGLLMPKRMYRGHQMWLENLDKVASGGAPA